MKEYRLGEWVDDGEPKEKEKSPIQRIADDISIIRAWVRFFSIITIIGMHIIIIIYYRAWTG